MYSLTSTEFKGFLYTDQKFDEFWVPITIVASFFDDLSLHLRRFYIK